MASPSLGRVVAQSLCLAAVVVINWLYKEHRPRVALTSSRVAERGRAV